MCEREHGMPLFSPFRFILFFIYLFNFFSRILSRRFMREFVRVTERRFDGEGLHFLFFPFQIIKWMREISIHHVLAASLAKTTKKKKITQSEDRQISPAADTMLNFRAIN